MSLSASNTSAVNNATSGHHNVTCVRKMSSSSYMRQSSCDSALDRTYVDLYTSDLNPSKNGIRRSFPTHNMYRYQSECNVISQISPDLLQNEFNGTSNVIDEATNRLSNSYTSTENGLHKPGPTVLEPSSLRYTKVSLSPSWTLTSPNGISEPAHLIYSRASSMTELTKRVQESSSSQGRTPLKMDVNNTSDDKSSTEQWVTSQLVYDRLRLAQRRNSKENRFEGFFNNSKSSYPSSNVDADGHSIGDKTFNVPVSPERDGEGYGQLDRSYSPGKVDDHSGISHRAIMVELSPKSPPGISPFKSSHEMHSRTSPGPLASSSDINFNIDNRQNLDRDISNSKYPGSGLVSSLFSQRDGKSGPQGREMSIQSNRAHSVLDLHKHSSSLDLSFDRGSELSLVNQSAEMYSTQQSKHMLQKGTTGNSQIQSDRTSYNIISTQSGLQGQHFARGDEKNNAYIVRSTLCYNTSTQTDLTRYDQARVSDPANGTPKLRRTEVHGPESITHTSPRTIDIKGKSVEDKSVQTAMFDFTDSSSDVIVGKLLEDTHGGDDDCFRKSFLQFNNLQTSSFTGTLKNRDTYASRELLHFVNDNSFSANAPYNSSDNDRVLGKLSGEYCSSGQCLMTEKRTFLASSRERPRLDKVTSDNQSGMRKPESYHSNTLRPVNKNDLNSRIYFGSVPSLADPRHDSSSMFSDSSNTNIDVRSSVETHNQDRPWISPKAKVQTYSNVSSSPVAVNRHREISSSFSESNLSPKGYLQFSPEPGRLHDLSFTSGLGSDISSIYSNPKCLSLDRKPSLNTSYSANLESSLNHSNHMHSSPPSSLDTTFRWKKIVIVNPEELRHDRLGSDSVFTDDDVPDEDLNKTLSPRTDFGFYNDVDRNMFDSTKTNANNDKVEHFLISADAITAMGPIISQSPKSRGKRYSESLGLRKIKEESDSGFSRIDNNSAKATIPGSGMFNSSFGVSTESGQEPSDMYHWKNEAWLRSHFDIPKGSLKRAASEQIIMTETPRISSSYDTEYGIFHNRPNGNKLYAPGTFQTYKKNVTSPLDSDTRTFPMRNTDDFTSLSNKQDLKMSQKNALLDFYERKNSISRSQKRNILTDLPSLDTSSSSIGNSSFSESVADVISKVNENIARSAQRVGRIRRNSSSSSRSSLDFTDTARPGPNRRETEWTRLRSLGPVRYSPDIDSRSNRSSLASDTLYEDINRSLPSTPRGSYTDSRERDFIQDPVSLTASIDNGLVYSSIHRTLPPKTRPSPPPTQSTSKETEPPALPPRKNRKSQQALIENKSATLPTSTMLQEPTKRPVSAKLKSPVHVIPLGKQQDDDVRVDNTQINFKDLMTQWKNNSPGDQNSDVGLRKQAHKYPNSHRYLQQQQQQQHHPHKQVNYIPAVYERTRINDNLDSTYKHEQTQKHDSASNISQASPLSSKTSIPSNISSLSSVTSSVSGAISPSFPSPVKHQPADDYPSSLHSTNISLSPKHQNGETIAVTNLAHYVGNAHATINNKDDIISSLPQTVPVSGARPSPKERTLLLEYSRSRSSSDLLSKQPPGGNDTGNAAREVQHRLRERSSSEYDILSDTRQHSQRPYQHKHEFGAPPGGVVLKPTDDDHEILMLNSPAKGGHAEESTFISNADLSKSPLGVTHDGENTQDELADKSCIGHTNKPSHTFDTYKRSTSSAMLQSGNIDNSLFHERQLSQQSWSSELVLSHTDVTVRERMLESNNEVNKTENEKTRDTKENLKGPNATPVRPPRPSVQGRHIVGKSPASPLLSSACVSQSSKCVSVSLSALDSVTTDTSIVPEHSRRLTRVGSSRRAPPSPPKSPPFDAKQSVVPDHFQTQQVSNPTRSSREVFYGEPMTNIPQSQYSPQRSKVLHDSSMNSNFWISSDINNARLPASQDGANQFLHGHHPSLTSQVAVTLPSRGYQRRESAPVGLMTSSSVSGNIGALEDPSLFSSLRSKSTSGSNIKNLDVYTPDHIRQPSHEELECDEKAKQLAEELEDKDRKLLQVLVQDASKKRMLYMNGLFSESFRASFSNNKSEFNQKAISSMDIRASHHGLNTFSDASDEFKRSSLPRDYQMSCSQVTESDKDLRHWTASSWDSTNNNNNNTTLIKHKEELIEKLHKKIEVLREEKVLLQQEMEDNNLLGTKVCQIADSRCQTFSERDKLKTYIDDNEKILRLLLNLSGQLARVENAVQALDRQAETKLKKLTLDKRERLHAKHEEAKLLKEDIDRRSKHLLAMLQERLSEQEFSDYKHFLKMKSKLAIEMQEVDDGIALGEQQLIALKESLSVPSVS